MLGIRIQQHEDISVHLPDPFQDGADGGAFTAIHVMPEHFRAGQGGDLPGSVAAAVIGDEDRIRVFFRLDDHRADIGFLVKGGHRDDDFLLRHLHVTHPSRLLSLYSIRTKSFQQDNSK